MTTLASDQHITRLEDDCLGRAPLVRDLKHVVENYRGVGAVRIGVYGEWGEGKSSVMAMLARELHPSYRATWFYPWRFDTPVAMRIGLLSQLADKLEASWSIKGIDRKIGLGGLARRWRTTSPIVDAAGHPGIGALIERAIESGLKKEVEAELQSKKLLLLVDDLDRVSPDLIPGLLMSITAEFDLPNLAVVVGMSPEVVSLALGSKHAGWNKARRFVEKAITHHRYLSPTTPESRRKLIEQLDGAVYPRPSRRSRRRPQSCGLPTTRWSRSPWP